MHNFDAWIGKKETHSDISSERPVAMMQALLNQQQQALTELPHLYHWFYFLPTVNSAELAEDGHPLKGGFLPPIPFPKRMWAGGRLEFFAPIAINQKIRRQSEIIKIEFKQGNSGAMYFVTVRHQVFTEETLALIEEQDIVYREDSPPAPTQRVASPIIKPAHYSYRKQFPINSATLFRYSAITFNSHRIHYDRPYATEVEGYSGLVVHGPLMATLLLHFFQQAQPNKQIQSFHFRALRPVFDFDDVYICGDVQLNQANLWIERSNHQAAVQASVTFRND